MFDIGWTEILVIVAVAVIVVGPKDIPKMLRAVGKYLRKAKTMMRDVRRQVEEVADMDEIRQLKAEAENIKKDIGINSFDDPMKTSAPAAKAEQPAQPQEIAEEKPKPKPKVKAKPKPRAKPKAKPKPKTAATKTTAKKTPVKKAVKSTAK